MSTHYSIEVHRKLDDEKLAYICANELKNIYDIYYQIPERLEYSDILTIQNETQDKITETFNEIKIYEIKILACRSKIVKESYEEEIRYLKESLNDYWIKYTCCAELIGKINGVILDTWSDEKKHYGEIYNAPVIDGKEGYLSVDGIYMLVK